MTSPPMADGSHAGPAGSAFRPDIQGLRAVAVLLVVVYHTGVLGLHGGYVGVDVFYVISGFLITGQLLSRLSRGRIGFADFYARRARRILPASFVVLILTLIASALFLPPVLRAGALWDGVWTALYVPNIAFAVQGTDYLAETAPSPFQHYWSLGVEEQFYLVLPLLLLLVWIVGRRRRSVVIVALAVAVLASFALGWWMTYQNQPLAFFLLPTRAWELGVGSLIAAIGPALAARMPGWARSAIGWAGLAAIAIAGLLYSDATPFPGVAAALPVLGAAAIIFPGQAASRGSVATLLALRPMQFIGRISYAWYLVHWPLMVIPAAAFGHLPVWAVLGLAALGFALAWVLNVTVEDPVRRNRWLAALKARWALIASGAASALTVAVTVLVIGVTSTASLDAGRPADPVDSLGAEPPVSPVFTGYVPSNLMPPLTAVADDVPVIYPDGCHRDVPDTDPAPCVYGDTDSGTAVALFGDSHAAQWFPALERLALEHGFRLDSYTKSSCPSVDVPLWNNAVPYDACALWRDAVVERLAAQPPAAIVISNMADQPDQPDGGIDPADWASGLVAVIEGLRSPVLVISDTPRFTETPAICLSASLSDASRCALPRAEAERTDWIAIEAEAARGAGASVLDVNDRLCTEVECGTIVGNVLLYRDAHHLTATAAALLAEPVWRALSPLLD